MTLLWRLFWSFFKIALLTLGGGFAIIAVADDVFSRRLKWTSEGELVERLSLFQTIPGILAGHCAVYVGQKVAGAAGAAAALTGVVLPSLVIFIAVSTGYASLPLADPWLGAAFAGLRAALAGVIVAMVVRGWSKSVRGVYGHAAVASGCAALASGVNPALVLVGAMAAGAVREYRSPRRTFCSLAPIVPLFLKYGLLAFGGGYVLVPLYMSDFVGSAAPVTRMAP
jgi:chromate transporter